MKENILYIMAAIVELTNILLCYTQILQAKIKTTKGIVCWIYGGIILCNVINIYCGLSIDQIAIVMLYCLLMPLVLMESNRIKWMLLYPCAFMLSSTANIAVSFGLGIILDRTQGDISEDTILALLSNMFFTLFMGLIYIYKKVRKIKYDNNLYISNSIYVTVTIGSIAFFVLISIVQFVGFEYDIPVIQMNVLGLAMSYACMVFLFIFLWLSITVRKNVTYQKEKELLNLYISEQKKYIELIVDKDRDMRKFRHDVREHMLVVSNCIDHGKSEEARVYINDVYKNFSESEYIKYTGIVSVDAVLSDKKRIMDEKGINLVWKGAKDRYPDKVAYYDLCTIFINVLNNAIEAVDFLDEGKRQIELVTKIDGEQIYIKERNIYIGNIVFDKNGNPETSKKDKKQHGFGGKNIRGVVEKYNGSIKYSVDNQLFCVEIIV